MVSIDPPRLTDSEETSIRTLHKSVRATRYEDPGDQQEFLIAAARSVLVFRKQVASFASNAELGECVFAIRAQMQVNNTRVSTPPDETFATITDFAGEIARTRQLVRDRRRIQSEKVRAEEGVAARAERRDALQHAAKLKFQKIRSPHEDVVSIPSDSESEDPPQAPALVATKASTATAEPAAVASPIPVRPAELLSPLLELENLMSSLRINNLPFGRPVSPSTPRSLPDLVPIDSPPFNVQQNERGRRLLRRNTTMPRRHRSPTHTPVNTRAPTPFPLPILAANTAVLIPRPANPIHRRRLSYVDASPALNPKSATSLQRRNAWRGSFKFSKTPRAIIHKPKNRRNKRCYFCSANSHLFALCPLRELD
ncbi:hypothetical protein C8R46DRAFT_581300 [Mycena filopes]|nr:hypothetical protein C8R46DRAFT_581300 [Mycena filopes]